MLTQKFGLAIETSNKLLRMLCSHHQSAPQLAAAQGVDVGVVQIVDLNKMFKLEQEKSLIECVASVTQDCANE